MHGGMQVDIDGGYKRGVQVQDDGGITEDAGGGIKGRSKGTRGGGGDILHGRVIELIVCSEVTLSDHSSGHELCEDCDALPC